MRSCRETSLGVWAKCDPRWTFLHCLWCFFIIFLHGKFKPQSCYWGSALSLPPLIKLSLSSKSLFEQRSAVLEGKEGMSSLLWACRVAESPSHVLTGLLTAEALWMHSIIISDKPLWHGPGSRERCLGHSTTNEAAPNESISAPLPLQEEGKKSQSALKSGLTSQKSCLLCRVIRNPLDNVWCHHTWQVPPDVLSFVENVMFASPGSLGCKTWLVLGWSRNWGVQVWIQSQESTQVTAMQRSLRDRVWLINGQCLCHRLRYTGVWVPHPFLLAE